MKFFIFTCLVAVALAKHAVKDQSSEESTRIYQRKYKQANDVFFQTPQDSASSSSSEEYAEEINDKIVQTEEQKVNLNEQKRIKQFSQDLSCSQFCIPVPQQQINMNQWAQGKAIRNIPNQEMAALESKACRTVSGSQLLAYNQMDMFSPPEQNKKLESISIVVQEILKKIIDLIKNSEFHQFNTPQYPRAVYQQQMPVTYWNKPSIYPYVPYVKYC